ncbi:MAG: hypothetical protein J0H86_04885 [Xanthomonadaceae bacterium]|nr:hypothetical protein [Xanthomonadaceae bacterium]
MRTLKTWTATGLWLVGSMFALQASANEEVILNEQVILGDAALLRDQNAAKEVTQIRALLSAPQAAATLAPQRGEARSLTDPVAKALTPKANSYRAYAPSCLAYPLPEQFSGPLYPANGSFRVLLAARDINFPDRYYEEIVNVRLWRIPCSSSGQFYDAVTLLAIDRDAANEGNSTRYPLFPGLRLTQGNNTRKLVRVADEPNTVTSHIYADEPLINSGTYVLENFATNDASTAFWDFNNAFTLTFYNFFQGDTGQPISVPAYNPTQATYPTAFGNVPVTGYLTGNWFDPAHSGEGMLIQVFDLPGTSTEKLLTFAWFTYGVDRLPFWLFGSARFPTDSRGPIVAETIYNSNGGFAGDFGASTTATRWGTVTFEFPSCYKMKFSYNGSAASAGGPSGSGTRDTWQRRDVELNGLTCE